MEIIVSEDEYAPDKFPQLPIIIIIIIEEDKSGRSQISGYSSEEIDKSINFVSNKNFI